MIRFQIILEEKTFNALRKLSILECREPRSQAVVLIREGLDLRGMLISRDSEKRELELMKNQH